jgi:hypothetical protein
METSKYLKISIGVLMLGIIVAGIAEVAEKENLKSCMSRQSFTCPRFTCPVQSSDCGSRPYIVNANGTNTCIGYCSTMTGTASCED